MKIYFLTAAFICGAAGMVLELLGARLLAPEFGTSIQVWSIIIAITLFALALGYYIGGRVIDARPQISVLSCAIGTTGLTVGIVAFTARPVVSAMTALGFIAGAFAAAAFVLLLPLLLLGMVVPSLIRLSSTRVETSGNVAGRLLAVSTAGGIAGTLAAGLVLIPWIGLSASLVGLAVVMLLVSGTGLLIEWRIRATILILCIGAAFSVLGGAAPLKVTTGQDEKILESVEGLYGNLQVVRDDYRLAILCNGIVQTVRPLSMREYSPGMLISARDYTELIPHFVPKGGKALVIGVGGGLHPLMLQAYDFEVQCVEIDPHMVELGRKYFGLRHPVAIEDGRVHVNRLEDHVYDAILLDAFTGESLPAHLLTLECFHKIRSVLKTRGVLCIHLIGKPHHATTLAVMRTLREVFAAAEVFQSGVGSELQQLYLFAGKSTLTLANRDKLEDFGFLGNEKVEVDSSRGHLLTDDLNPLGIINSDLAVELRRIYW